MARATKVAVSLPEEVFDAVERKRERLGRSRSAVVTEALVAWLRDLGEDDADRRYERGYLRQPERVDNLASVAAEAVGAWEAWEE